MRRFITLAAAVAALLLPVTGGAKDYPGRAEQCEPIRKEVERLLAQVGASPAYFYLMVAESHCNGDAVSKAGAVGYWQLMPRTARKYGCNNPRDLECATLAAGRYLVHLEEKCGADEAIFCWHDGGSNYLRKGRTPTKGAAALRWQFRYLQRTDTRRRNDD